MANATFPRKNGRAWSIAALVFWIIFFCLSCIIAFAPQESIFLVFFLSLFGLLSHCIIFMCKRPIPLPATVLISAVNVVILIVVSIITGTVEDWSVSLIFAMTSIVPLVCYGLHILLPRYFCSFEGMTWEETKRMAEHTPKYRMERDILAREKAYARIDKYHDYLQRGVISQEEYETERRRILESLENR